MKKQTSNELVCFCVQVHYSRFASHAYKMAFNLLKFLVRVCISFFFSLYHSFYYYSSYLSYLVCSSCACVCLLIENGTLQRSTAAIWFLLLSNFFTLHCRCKGIFFFSTQPNTQRTDNSMTFSFHQSVSRQKTFVHRKLIVHYKSFALKWVTYTHSMLTHVGRQRQGGKGEKEWVNGWEKCALASNNIRFQTIQTTFETM